MSLSIQIGNFLYHHAYGLYKPMYKLFKNRQDAFEIGLLRKHIRPGSTVIDIGANIGFYSSLFSEMTGPNGLVHCFEPDVTNFNHLKNTVNGLSNVVINKKAVGPRTEKLKVYTSKQLNVDHRTYKPAEYEHEVEVDAVSLDDYLGNGTADVVKMDIQGFEMQAISGMRKTLTNNPYILLLSEFWPYGLDKAGSSVSAYYNFLVDLGFKVYLLEGGKLRLLDARAVSDMEKLPEEQYFNIFAGRHI